MLVNMSNEMKTLKCHDAIRFIYRAAITRFGETQIDIKLCFKIAHWQCMMYRSHCSENDGNVTIKQ